MQSECESSDSRCSHGEASNSVGGTAECLGKVKFTVVDGLNNPIVAIATCEGSVSFEELCEFFKLLDANGLNLLHDRPLKALSARGRSQRAVIAPELGHVHSGKEVAEGNLGWCLKILSFNGCED